MKAIISMTRDGKISLKTKRGLFKNTHTRTVDIHCYPIIITEAYTFLTGLESMYSVKSKEPSNGWVQWSLSFQHKIIQKFKL